MSIPDWSTTAANNTSIGAISIAEGCPPGNLNNAIRELMANLRDDFEEDSCTLSIIDSLDNAATMGAGNVFRFHRRGNMVFVSGTLNWSSLTALNAASRIKITGLPYAVRNVTGYRVPAVFGPAAASSFLIERQQIAFYADPNADFLWGTKVGSGNTAGNLVKGDLGSTGTLYGLSISYLTDYY